MTSGAPLPHETTMLPAVAAGANITALQVPRESEVDPGFRWPHMTALSGLYSANVALSFVLNFGIVHYERTVSDNRRTLINKVSTLHKSMEDVSADHNYVVQLQMIAVLATCNLAYPSLCLVLMLINVVLGIDGGVFCHLFVVFNMCGLLPTVLALNEIVVLRYYKR